MKNYAINTKVQWQWGNGKGTGKIVKKYTQGVTKTINGTEVTRNASDDNPAYLIEQDDSDQVLKSHSEIDKE